MSEANPTNAAAPDAADAASGASIAQGLKDRAAAAKPGEVGPKSDQAAQPGEVQPAAAAKPQENAAAAEGAKLQELINAAVAAKVGPLQAKLDGYEKEAGNRQAVREAEEVREEFIKDTMRNFPAALCRKLLPVTKDKDVLHREAKLLETWMGQAIAEGIQKHRFRVNNDGAVEYQNIGGDSGGTSTREWKPDTSNAPPAAQIAAGLKNRGGNGHRIDNNLQH